MKLLIRNKNHKTRRFFRSFFLSSSNLEKWLKNSLQRKLPWEYYFLTWIFFIGFRINGHLCVWRGRIFIVYHSWSTTTLCCLIVRSIFEISKLFFRWWVEWSSSYQNSTDQLDASSSSQLFFQFDTHREDGGCFRWWLTAKKITSRLAKTFLFSSFRIFFRNFTFSFFLKRWERKSIDRKKRPLAP